MLNGVSAAFGPLLASILLLPFPLLLLNNGFALSMNWDVTLHEVLDATCRPIPCLNQDLACSKDALVYKM